MKVTVKVWFLNKTLDARTRQEVTNDFFVKVTTAKAYLLEQATDHGVVRFWCPISCTLKEGEVDPDLEREVKKMQSGLEYNQTLLEFAKAHGVKGVRKGMRTETIKYYIEDAGLKAPARA